MTIGDLEARTGIPRANIRYYEQEGLLSPQRMENGYRNYRQEDLETLLRIKLLRQLNFSLEEIRQLQQGTLDFSKAMASRGIQLARERDQLDITQQVCSDIGRDVRSFQELQPERYLQQLSQARPASHEAAASPLQPPQEWSMSRGVDRPPLHPWRRFFARSLDVGLAGLALIFIRYAILHTPPSSVTSAASFLTALLSWGMLLVMEPLWIHFLGTTPGKWVWGIRVEAYGGGKLGLGDAYRRTFGVFLAGEGMCIPIANIVCNVLSYRKYVREEELYWESESVLRFRERRWVSPALHAAGIALLLSLGTLSVLLSMLPPCHGNLTLPQFVKNFNTYRDYLGISDGYYLDDNGTWIDEDETFIIRLQEPQNPAFVFEVEDGTVHAVSYTLDLSQREEPVWLTNVYGELAYLALAAARPGTHIGNIQKMMQTTVNWDATGDFKCHWKDVSMTYTVESAGFDSSTGLNALIPTEGRTDNHVTVTFRAEIVS